MRNNIHCCRGLCNDNAGVNRRKYFFLKSNLATLIKIKITHTFLPTATPGNLFYGNIPSG